AFIFSKTDSKGETFANNVLKNIKNTKALEKELKFTGKQAVAGGKLTGNSLLKLPETQKWVKSYLGLVLEARGNKERRERKTDTYRYWYTLPKGARATKLQKPMGEEVGWVDVATFMRGQ